LLAERSFTALLAGGARSAFLAALGRIEKDPTAGAEGETGILERDGHGIAVDWSAQRIGVEGRSQVVLILRDARERRYAIQLMQEARDAAEAASQAKSEHLSRMSHELRTPLTAILGYAELLELDMPAEHRPKIEAILKASSHLLNMVNDVLDISRTTAGHVSESLEAVDAGAAIADCVAILEPRATHRGIPL